MLLEWPAPPPPPRTVLVSHHTRHARQQQGSGGGTVVYNVAVGEQRHRVEELCGARATVR